MAEEAWGATLEKEAWEARVRASAAGGVSEAQAGAGGMAARGLPAARPKAEAFSSPPAHLPSRSRPLPRTRPLLAQEGSADQDSSAAREGAAAPAAPTTPQMAWTVPRRLARLGAPGTTGAVGGVGAMSGGGLCVSSGQVTLQSVTIADNPGGVIQDGGSVHATDWRLFADNGYSATAGPAGRLQ